MAVSNQSARSPIYTGNGATTVFPFSFAVLNSQEVAVSVDGAVQGDGYGVILNARSAEGGAYSGGSVTFDIAPANGTKVLLYSEPAFGQGVEFENAGAFLPSSHDDVTDRAAVEAIYLKDRTDRSLRAPVGEAMVDLPDATLRAGKFIAFDSEGNPIVTEPSGSDGALRADLAASSGSTLLGFSGRSAQTKFRELALSPKDYGAVGDGIANDIAAVSACLTDAFASGLPVEGGESVYGVSGNLTFNAITRPWIKGLRLKQLSPVNGRVTLGFTSCEQVRIDHLQVDAGTLKTAGDMNSTFGLYIDGGSNHNVRNVEAFGHGRNSLVALWNTSKSSYSSIKVRDAEFDFAGATDDVLQGIWLSNCTDCVLNAPIVSNLTGNASYVGTPFANLRTRGIVLTGCVRVSIVEPKVSNVEQGIDVTGSAGNRQCTITGGTTFECGSVGVKFANSAVDCKCIGHTANRIGMYGFLACGPAEAGLTYKTMDCDFIACTAIDVGYNGISLTNKAGFEVLQGDYDTSYPKGVRLVDCKAFDRQGSPTMKYGFYCNVIYDAAAKKPNEVIGGSSLGHIASMQTGFHRHTARANGGSTFVLTNNAETTVPWNNTLEATTLMHSQSVNPERITISIPGLYRVRTSIVFNTSNTGLRRANIRLDGTLKIERTDGAPTSSAASCISLDMLIDCPAGGVLTVNAFQTSGGDLNLDRSVGYFEADLVKAA